MCGDPIDIFGLCRCDNRRTVLLQDGNIIGYNLPCDFGIDSTIAMRYDIAVKRLHTAVPHHHEWNLKSAGLGWWLVPDRPVVQENPLNQGEVPQAESL